MVRRVKRMETKNLADSTASERELRRFNDVWANAFANRLGTDVLPNERVRRRFISFVLTEKTNERLTEKYILNQFPKFINYLAEL